MGGRTIDAGAHARVRLDLDTAPRKPERARVVIVHDFMETYGGAERVTAELAAAYPDAPVYALLGRLEVAQRMGIADRFHSIVAPRRRILRDYRLLAPLWPRIVESAVLPEADVLLSSSYAFAHGFQTPNRAPHISYCHSPLRFAWSMTGDYRAVYAPGLARGLTFKLLAARMRRADLVAAGRVERFLTQSPFTSHQIRACYGRQALAIGAPVDTDRFVPGDGDVGDYFLICSRLVEPYKRVSLAIEAFRGIDARLVIAGDGPARAELEAKAPSNVEFLGHLSDREVIPLMQHCRALVFPSTDDFGLVPVEAMACGRPVIAYADGGALFTVEPGVTGVLFDDRNAETLRAIIRRFDHSRWDTESIRAHALRWGAHNFRLRVRDAVDDVLDGPEGIVELPPVGSRRRFARKPAGTGALLGASLPAAPVTAAGSVS